MYARTNSGTLQSFVIVQHNLAEHLSETNLPATSAQADKQTRIQSAHGNEEWAKGLVPPKSQGPTSAHRQRREVIVISSSEIAAAVLDETRNPSGLSSLLTRYHGRTVSPKRRGALFFYNRTTTARFTASRIFCKQKHSKRSRTQSGPPVDEGRVSKEQGHPHKSVDTRNTNHERCLYVACARATIASPRLACNNRPGNR